MSLFQYFTVFFTYLFMASFYLSLITFVHNRHLLSKDFDLSAKFDKYPGLIGMTLRRLVTMIRDKTAADGTSLRHP
jgi:hypothetical protein